MVTVEALRQLHDRRGASMGKPRDGAGAQRLESRGLITRVSHEQDGRRVHLRVTRAGARLNAPGAAGTVEEAVRRVLRQMNPRHRSITVAVLEHLASSLLSTAEDRPKPVRARRRASRLSRR